MPDREPLPPLDQWPAPRRWRERNASSLTRAQRGDIVQQIIDARRNGVPPGQAYGAGRHDDWLDAVALDRHAQPFLSTILTSTAAPESLMPIQLSIGNNNLGLLMSQQDADLLARFGQYPATLPANVVELQAQYRRLTEEHERTLGEMASMSRRLVAMEGRIAHMERAFAHATPEVVRPINPSRNEARPAVPFVAGNPIANVRDAPVDVTARSVPPGSAGASPATGTARDEDDARTHGRAAAPGGSAAPAGAAGVPAPNAPGTPAVPSVGSATGVVAPTAAGVIVTIDQLRAAITAYTQRFGIERGRVLMLEHGRASTVSTVPAERRATVLAAIQAASEIPTAAAR